MKVSLLGPISLEVGEEVVPLSSMIVRTVLALLALHPGRTISSAHLMEEIWGDDDLRNARNALQATVARLRRSLAEQRNVMLRPTLRTAPSGYCLDIAPDRVDALKFVDLARAGRNLVEADPAAALVEFENALRLWRGSPLEDMPNGSVLRAERGRLEESRAETFELRAQARISVGQLRGAAAELRQLVGIYPDRERLHELLMIVLHQGGQQSEALLVFRNLRSHLSLEFGIEPGGRLHRLHDAILTQRALPAHVLEGVS